MALRIREETPEDFAAIHALTKQAFATARVTNGDEHTYVDRLRAGSGYLPDLSLAMEEDGILVGHVMLSRLAYSRDDGRDAAVHLLAPVSVLPARHGEGIGSALVRVVMERARRKGCEAIILVGEPAYHRRFGFAQADAFGIRYDAPIPAEYVLAAELVDGGLAPGVAALVAA